MPEQSAPREPQPPVSSDSATAADLPPALAPWAASRWFLERTGLLLLTGGVLFVLGLRGLPLLVTALVLSGVLSYFLLFRVRNAAAGNVERRVSGISGWFRGREAAEDRDDDLTPSGELGK